MRRDKISWKTRNRHSTKFGWKRPEDADRKKALLILQLQSTKLEDMKKNLQENVYKLGMERESLATMQ